MCHFMIGLIGLCVIAIGQCDCVYGSGQAPETGNLSSDAACQRGTTARLVLRPSPLRRRKRWEGYFRRQALCSHGLCYWTTLYTGNALKLILRLLSSGLSWQSQREHVCLFLCSFFLWIPRWNIFTLFRDDNCDSCWWLLKPFIRHFMTHKSNNCPFS